MSKNLKIKIQKYAKWANLLKTVTTTLTPVRCPFSRCESPTRLSSNCAEKQPWSPNLFYPNFFVRIYFFRIYFVRIYFVQIYCVQIYFVQVSFVWIFCPNLFCPNFLNLNHFLIFLVRNFCPIFYSKIIIIQIRVQYLEPILLQNCNPSNSAIFRDNFSPEL
jgi:hypothetical protein